MGCCSSKTEKDNNDSGKQQSPSSGQTTTIKSPNDNGNNNTTATFKAVASGSSTLEAPKPELKRTESQEERERHERQLSYLDKVYREKRVTERKEKEAKLAKLNSDRSERLEKQWENKDKTIHFTARELFLKMCKDYPYDIYKYETYIKSFYSVEDDFGVVADEEDEPEVDEALYTPPDGNTNEVLDKTAFFACLKELLLPIPTKEELHKNLDESQMSEKDVKMMEEEIDKQHSILWAFFIYSPEEQLIKKNECDIRTYMTYDDFTSGLSGLISATVDWTSKAHKQISDTLFQIMDHDRDGYLDNHDITALLLALHKIHSAVFNYEPDEEPKREDVEEQAIALIGMDWGPSKVEQPVQYLNKRQWAHLFGELGEKQLKDLDLDAIINGDNPSSPRALRQ